MRNILRGIAGVLAALAHVDEAQPAVAARRLQRCHVCEWRRGRSCSACGCIVTLKVKVASEDCPHGLWD